MAANELSALLWRERELLGLLTFKLEEEQLLLTTGNTKWLHHATREVEQVVERLRSHALSREVAVAALATEWNLGEQPTLRDIVARAPEGPWAEIFDAHLKELLALTARIKELRDANEVFLRAAVKSTQETLAELRSDAGTYDSLGVASAASGISMLDREL
ncbi:flagellar protein FlgN [Pseudarthrobacter phenanthrenivorans]|uniref:flagellar protein FlgN n=1 Tax=Pseudarthrobacter phenanthrenivorans TaxID=361575 RepID=UPI001127439F|nr:flagellar protein FlgN [Pseudarthrobacter phenanthrenivorans]TPV52556.1 flagellar protein FlgN [Pseudarthrobacter phenanthrenivorans]